MSTLQAPRFANAIPDWFSRASDAPSMDASPTDSGAGDGQLPVFGGGSANEPAATASDTFGGAASGGKFVINISYDSSVTSQSNALQIETAINAAVSFYEHAFAATNMTITIHFGYGEVNGHSLSGGNLAQSEFSGASSFTYAQVKAALTARATSADDLAAVATLPASDPTNGGSFLLTQAEAYALGLSNTTPTNLYVGLSNAYTFAYDPVTRTTANSYDAVGELEHEISETLGRYGSLGQNFGTGVYEPLDLFRYFSAGVRNLSYGSNSSAAEYFSINGSQMLVRFNNPLNGGDPVDLLPSIQGDSYGDGYQNVISAVTGVDMRTMDVIGYTRSQVTRADLSGYGVSFVLLQGSGAIIDWSLTNGVATSGHQLGAGLTGWNVVATGDYNGDAVADVLLQNGGSIVDWTMQGGLVTGGVQMGVATGWTVVGSGDFNGDFTADVLLQSGGSFVDWIVQNGVAVAGNLLGSGLSGWSVVGTGDVNGDGVSDIILQNGGSVVAWDMRNGAVSAGAQIGVATGWTVVGAGDFNGDGTTDLLLQQGGSIVDWIGQNNVATSGHLLGSGLTGWTVAGTGDYNGDGVSDILLQNGSTVVDWTMSNGLVHAGVVVGSAATYKAIG